jgi:DNA-binding MarR family transcriptional regulator
MAVNPENPIFVLHRTHDILRRKEDEVFGAEGLYTEQYEVLMAIKHLDKPVRVTDVGLRLMRSPNAVSMIVDRMVKTGLIKRTRDRHDRRAVQLSLTDKAENLIEAARPAGQQFIQRVLAPLSYEDKQALIRILSTIQHEALAIIE